MKTHIQYKIQRHIEDSIKINESCSVISIPGAAGLLYTFHEIKKEFGEKIGAYYIDTIVSAETTVKNLKQNPPQKPILIGLFTENYSDTSWFIDQLESLELAHRLISPIIIISTIQTVYLALQRKSKLLFKSLYVPDFLRDDELVRYIDLVAEKLQTPVGFTDMQMIADLSGGHVGLIKNLLKVVKRGSALSFSTQEMMKQPEIALWLQEITQGIDEELLQKIVRPAGLTFEQATFLTTFKFIVKDQPFSPLLSTYLTLRFPQTENYSIPKVLKVNLSSQEYKVLAALWEHPEAILTKDEIAQALWGSQYRAKYSEWAITQVMARLRKKLAQLLPEIKIVNKKGEGYILVND